MTEQVIDFKPCMAESQGSLSSFYLRAYTFQKPDAKVLVFLSANYLLLGRVLLVD
jgi:hypothetical protein